VRPPPAGRVRVIQMHEVAARDDPIGRQGGRLLFMRAPGSM
jgi:hypothetical protein